MNYIKLKSWLTFGLILLQLGWLPLMLFCFADSAQQILFILATASCVLAFACYGYLIARFSVWAGTEVYNRCAKSIKAVKHNQLIFNEFVKWARENDKNIV
ncbi:hypothetical protein ABX022_01860 [Snodgrassella alvi]|uniref:hypothetical protein n=1 Tax=Snodgrassella alvi TaxID=1196083 RepID=UPI0029E453A3|nr:hypothetical protein [Snodgrassella alvi]